MVMSTKIKQTRAFNAPNHMAGLSPSKLDNESKKPGWDVQNGGS